MREGLRFQDVWLQERFSEYYRRNPPDLPDRFGRREFAFLFFGQKFMLRHLALRSRPEFFDFLHRRGPAHAYYSTAYYQEPGAPTMNEKGWLGAELIFDLDADHVPGAEKLPYVQQLEKVKFHFLRLVEEFVVGDFGFEEKDLLLTFSGGRGYHCHVLHEKALQLSSQERREVVDFITGTGLDLDLFLRREVVGTKGRGSYARPEEAFRISPATAPAWGGRLNRAVREYVAQLRALPPEELANRFADHRNIGEKRLAQLQQELQLLTDERLAQGKADTGSLLSKILPGILREAVVPLAKGETDEPVTSDTKRLIRLPGSLHGKSGLRVVKLRLDEVRDFDPLRDAVAFGSEPVRIHLEKPSKVVLAGFVGDLGVGEHVVPESAAVMLVARGAASPVV